ncbi:hypothetical protein ACQKWADRAFT_297917 [Trichoderma austrokoningii]
MLFTSLLPLLMLAVAPSNAAPTANDLAKRQTGSGFCNPKTNTCELSNGQVYGCNNGYNCNINDGVCYYLDGVVLCGQ